jgi:alkylation response protein AidB-like acyl-CoA dehydrogenase
MNFDYSAEQLREQTAFADYCRQTLAPLPSQIERMPLDDAHREVREIVKRLGDKGYLGVDLPRQLGGGGKSLLDSLPFHQQVAASHPAAFVSSEASAGMVGGLLSRIGAASHQEELHGIISGTTLAAWAATEADAGSDISAISTTAEKVSDGWRLNGTKSMVTNAPMADLLVVLAVTGCQAEANEYGLFLVPADIPGVAFGEPVELIGLRGTAVADVTLNQCDLPEESLLGGQRDGGNSLYTEAMGGGHLRHAAFAIGLAEVCLSLSLDHATSRRIAGRTLMQSQEVSFKLADMRTMIDAATQLTRYAAWLLDRGDPQAPALISCARLLAGDSATRIALMAQQVFGSEACRRSSELERIYRDIRTCELCTGSSDLQRIAIAQHLSR